MEIRGIPFEKIPWFTNVSSSRRNGCVGQALDQGH